MLGDGDRAWDLFGLINPINHSRTNREYTIYKVEPYVMAADVYGEHPHIGRGGWTWYTGAAGWMYKAGVENILGFQKNGDRLILKPCIPKRWTSYSIKYKYMQTTYEINIQNPENCSTGVIKTLLDGNELENSEIPLINDLGVHVVEITMGSLEVETE